MSVIQRSEFGEEGRCVVTSVKVSCSDIGSIWGRMRMLGSKMGGTTRERRRRRNRNT